MIVLSTISLFFFLKWAEIASQARNDARGLDRLCKETVSIHKINQGVFLLSHLHASTLLDFLYLELEHQRRII